jgi:hypothetical protein
MLDSIAVRKWLQKGSFVQQVSNLCHDPLIPHQSNWGERSSVSGDWKKVILVKSVVRPGRETGVGMR